MKKDFLFKEKQIKSMNKEEFIDCFEGYIIKAGNKYARQNTSLYDFEDIKQIAIIGLLKAYNNYDIEQGNTISTVANKYINQECLNYIRQRTYNRKPVCITSLNEELKDSKTGNMTQVIDYLEDNINLEQYIINKIIVKSIMNEINNHKHKSILLRYVDGDYPSKIAKANNLELQYVQNIIKNWKRTMRIKFKDVI